jgi:ubiquinone/menaquinone biosynthesis C-methylase UbiE
VEHAEAVALIQKGVGSSGGIWADLGAGSGVFTRALSTLLGRDGLVYAVDREPQVQFLQQHTSLSDQARIIFREADFTHPLGFRELNGILVANALHFVRDHENVLTQLVGYLKSGGRLLLVEYDSDARNPWVPYPVPRLTFERLAVSVGLGELREVGRRRSRFGHGDIYAAVGVKR